MGKNDKPKPGSKEWQEEFNRQVAEHDAQVKGTSEGQDFEIAPPSDDNGGK